MKWLLSLLITLLLLLQYKLWVSDGGIPEVFHLQQEVEKQREHNQALTERNASLDAEVSDLKQGLDAIEERARSELGMIRKDEVFYQVIAPSSRTQSSSAQLPRNKSEKDNALSTDDSATSSFSIGGADE